ncbi:TlpA family protein disulfide reductase [Thalassotalea euphylliae]|uniref:TlpA family protein disulfide reductase n=1 Tax=Thalassotalea euphylliae TaxID=1655234 RepID=A0A3E0U463_9GAMM|nr:TlpA family protein disulfide reductase [Thalassotalea euphylliae]
MKQGVKLNYLFPSRLRRFVNIQIKGLLILSLSAACVVFSNASVANSYEEKVQKSLAAIGQPIEAIDLASLDGQSRSFSELQGRASVIYFFASWCAPCYKTLRDIEQIRQQKLDVNLVVIALDDDKSAVSAMLKKTGFTGETWLANDGAKPLKTRLFANAYKVLPYVIKLDSNLVLVEHSYDIKSLAQWQEVLAAGKPLSQATLGN